MSRHVLSLLVVALGSPAFAAEPVSFQNEVRPILVDICFQCHGPDKNQRKADLRLDLRDEAVDHGAIVPGQPDKSDLITRLFSTDPKTVMPPPKFPKQLSAAQKDLLRRWVAEGAVYKLHWSFEPPVKPAVPAGQHAVDHLVGKQLAKAGLQASPEADRRTLARRLAFDLTGLPPSPADVEAFVADKSPEAYEQFVARQFASPHYGERMALGWLDVVRFADTIGYHSDNPRNVYPYRDWVIRSFQENLPFDRFTVEQLAGDLLPNSTVDQKVASAFNRLLLSTEEGGAQARDYEARMLGDRVRAVGTVWLGLTLGCCQCHDHKFDPATMRDFYSMGAFFADIKEPIIGRREDGMAVPSPEQREKLATLQAAVAALQQKLDGPQPQLADAFAAWERGQADAVAADAVWTPLAPTKVSAVGSKLAVQPDRSVLASGKSPDKDTYTVEIKGELTAAAGLRIEALPDASLPSQGPGRAGNGNFVLTEVVARVVQADGTSKDLPFAAAHATFEQTTIADKNPHKAWTAASVIDGDAKGDEFGWAVLPRVGQPHQLLLEWREPVTLAAGDTLVVELKQNHGAGGHTLGRFRLATTASAEAARRPTGPLPNKEVVDLVNLPRDKRSPAQHDRMFAIFKEAAPELVELRSQLVAAKKAVTDHEAAFPKCLVSISDKPRTVRLLPRGNWLDDSGPVMQPALPGFLTNSVLGKTAPEATVSEKRLDRLDLARWIVARENPLPARVFANRLWKQFFGLGLSKTLDDLGAQGEPPLHGELLDWLACEFVDSGWNVQHLIRTIVTSRTYRQVSTATKEQLQRDPDNRWLARQSRFRLDAELVRDNALAVSGLLVRKIGGPSVKPYQPDGYWENLNFPTRTWAADTGEGQYRRGLYTWWQRSFLHPSLMAFDAPSREECAADRTRSNIPQQALVLLNDPSYVEAARSFATRMLREGGADAAARVDWAWRQALQRAPREDERRIALQLVEKHRTDLARDEAAVTALLKVGIQPVPTDLDRFELAAWTSVARVLLNLHESITRS